jgi:hypothetical protein
MMPVTRLRRMPFTMIALLTLVAATATALAAATHVASAQMGRSASPSMSSGPQRPPSVQPAGTPSGKAGPVTPPQRPPSAQPPGNPPSKAGPVTNPKPKSPPTGDTRKASQGDKIRQCERNAQKRFDDCAATCGVLTGGGVKNWSYARCINGCSRILDKAVRRCSPA